MSASILPLMMRDEGDHDGMTDYSEERLAIEANRQAAIAIARMDAHVIECSGRYREVRETMTDLRDQITHLSERMAQNFEVRQQQFDQVRRDNRMLFFSFLAAGGGWVVLIALHFIK